jgi:hypothetical protein
MDRTTSIAVFQSDKASYHKSDAFLFFGIAHWIIKKLWIDGNKITKHDLEKMEQRAKTIQIPADLGRVPNKIATGEGFSRFTADQ